MGWSFMFDTGRRGIYVAIPSVGLGVISEEEQMRDTGVF